MTALHGAVPLTERDDVPVCVREQLYLDVARTLEIALAVEGSVVEGSRGLALGCGECVVELDLRSNDAHPSATTSRCCLDEQRKTDLLGCSVEEHRNPSLAGDPLGRELVAAEPKRLRRRADPRQPCGLDGFCKVAALRQKSVAGMDRVGPARLRSTDVFFLIEVARDLDRVVRRSCVE